MVKGMQINIFNTERCAAHPIVMGIVNVTADSFFSGSRVALHDAVHVAGQMLEQGAAIIDIGGQSTRPGADLISEEEELARTVPAIQAIAKAFPEAVISVDTFRATVAERALQAGASVVNDVSGTTLDNRMMDVLAQYRPAYVLMHMRGTPQSMQQQTDYDDVTAHVLHWLSQKLLELRLAGVHDVAVDPGFGFAKTPEQGFALLRQLHQFRVLNKPVMAGISRKSMVYKTLGATADEALNGTTALHMAALISGAGILRVHDVKPAREAIALYMKMR
jgi:dihydropteroate synthase